MTVGVLGPAAAPDFEIGDRNGEHVVTLTLAEARELHAALSLALVAIPISRTQRPVIYCAGSGRRWHRSQMLGVPACPECGAGWFSLGVQTEPAMPSGATIPMHNRGGAR